MRLRDSINYPIEFAVRGFIMIILFDYLHSKNIEISIFIFIVFLYWIFRPIIIYFENMWHEFRIYKLNRKEDGKRK